jgi:putative hydrolase of the HAD superfamily
MRADLEALGILGLLDATTFSSEVGTRKPDPAIFADALAKLEVDAAGAVFVGDRVLDDVGGAKAAGMRAVLTREFRQEEPTSDPMPDATIERLGELPGALASLES